MATKKKPTTEAVKELTLEERVARLVAKFDAHDHSGANGAVHTSFLVNPPTADAPSTADAPEEANDEGGENNG